MTFFLYDVFVWCEILFANIEKDGFESEITFVFTYLKVRDDGEILRDGVIFESLLNCTNFRVLSMKIYFILNFVWLLFQPDKDFHKTTSHIVRF